MKRKSKSIGEQLPPVLLFFEDIEKIIEILGGNDSKNIEIHTEDYIIYDIKDLKSLDSIVLNSLTIRDVEQSISLEISPSRVWLFALNETNESRGIYEKLRQLLKSRKRKFLKPIYGVFTGSLILGTSSSYFYFDNLNLSIAIVIALVHFILGIIWGYKSQTYLNKYSNKIFLKYSNEMPSFWKRKRDDIFVAIFAAIAGSLITLLITLLSIN